MKKILLYISLLAISISINAQEIVLSDQAEISVITVDPGYTQLYDTFGHSAFRVRDKSIGMDVAFNYGMFNFNTPNFNLKFAQGKLLYYLGVYSFNAFYRNYSEENRTIREQILNLSLSEKQAFFNFLQNNAKPAHRSYLYDFFYDNCATRLKDVSKNVLEEKVEFNYQFIEGKDETLRSLIHQYAQKRHPWGTFGIDLALGSIIDKEASTKDYLFLPDNIFKAFEFATIEGKPLVQKMNVLYKAKNKEEPFQIFTPVFFFIILMVLVIWITYRDYKNQKRSRWLDFSLFLFTGLIGTVVFLLWFATDHTATKGNFNLLWAFVPNLFIAFVLLKKKVPNWIKYYCILLIILILLNAVLWIFKVQIFSIAIIPLLLMLGLRYWYLYRQANLTVY